MKTTLLAAVALIAAPVALAQTELTPEQLQTCVDFVRVNFDQLVQDTSGDNALACGVTPDKLAAIEPILGSTEAEETKDQMIAQILVSG